jgi:hypothetical protein
MIRAVNFLAIFSFALFAKPDLMAQSSYQYSKMLQGFQDPPASAQPVVYPLVAWRFCGYSQVETGISVLQRHGHLRDNDF